MGGLMSRRKGAGFELELVRFLQDRGLAAVKQPLSGALEQWKGDVSCPVLGEDKTFEAKRRAAGFKTIYSMLGDHYGLFIRDNHVPALVVLRLEDFAKLARGSA